MTVAESSESCGEGSSRESDGEERDDESGIEVRRLRSNIIRGNDGT